MDRAASKNQATRRASEVDEAAFGVIYGTITVLSLLMAVHQPIEDPLWTGLIMIGAVTAVALAKAYAEVCKQMLANSRPANLSDLSAAWRHSRTVLLAANLPAACLLLAAIHVLPIGIAFTLAQIAATMGLVYFGGLIGWRISRSVWSVAAGAGVTAIIGLLISSLKYLAH